MVIFGALHVFWNTRSRNGPDSPNGYRVDVQVTDAGWSWSADHYAEVIVRDRSGRERAKWDDSNGQQSMEGVDRLVSSMRWKTAEMLEFQTAEGETVFLEVAP
jgi:hypothetical protein